MNRLRRILNAISLIPSNFLFYVFGGQIELASTRSDDSHWLVRAVEKKRFHQTLAHQDVHYHSQRTLSPKTTRK